MSHATDQAIRIRHKFVESGQEIPPDNPYWIIVTKFALRYKTELNSLRDLQQKTLTAFGNESNIPSSHGYWFIANVIKNIEEL